MIRAVGRLFLFCLLGAFAPFPLVGPSPAGEQPAVRRDAGVPDVESLQHAGPGRVETRPHEMEIEWGPPDWFYTSPEDAERLKGWESGFPPDAPRELLPPAAPPSPLERAWALYRRGRPAEAAALFRSQLELPELSRAREARLGLAYSLLRQGRRREALPHLERLLREGHRVMEVRRALIELLVAEGRYPAALTEIDRLPAREREAALRRLLEARLGDRLRALPPEPALQKLEEILDAERESLARCIRPDLFHGLARLFARAGAAGAGAELDRRLLACPLEPSLRLGILAGLTPSLPEEEALELLASQRGVLAPLDPGTARLEDLEVALLRRRLARLSEGEAARIATAAEILSRRPDDAEALAVLAWERLRRGEAEEAERLFTRLLASDPSNRDAALGAGWARLQSGREEQALAPFSSGAIPEDEEVRSLRRTALRRQADRAMAEGRSADAAAGYEELLRIDPQDRDAADGLARALLRRGPEAGELERLKARAQTDPSPALVVGLLDHFRESGMEDSAWDLACRAARSPEPAVAAAAAPFFFGRGLPVTASQLDPDETRCYRNAFSPRAEAFGLHRSRDTRGRYGDLEETSFPLSAFHAVGLGRTASIHLTPRLLRGNEAKDPPPVGRAYRGGAPQRERWEDDLLVLQPDAGLEIEGRIPVALHLGTTPLGGPVSAEPTFSARLGSEGGYLEAHRLSVRDSILSWVGQKDPYSRASWGRVTRLGAEAGKTFPFEGIGWLALNAGFDHYDGKNVIENQALRGGVALGRTHLVEGDEWSYGVFLSLAHFRRNSDFSTFGHGGYYSPQLFSIAGPFARLRTAACRDFWVDLQLSAGWLHQRRHRSDRYPLDDYTGPDQTYDGGADHRLGASLRMQGMKQITPYVALGGLASLGASGDWTEWRVGVGIQVFFEPQNAFWIRRDFFRDFGDPSNR
ncbi:MAG: cellulose synthase subunit BcsC-related outer membrane protein [Desulfobacterales bacterium]